MLRGLAVACLSVAALAWPCLRPAAASQAEIDSVRILTRAGMPASILVPQDTFLVRIGIQDDDGFHDIKDVEIRFQYGDLASGPPGPAFRGVFQCTQDDDLTWELKDLTSTSWAIVPSWCSPDTFPNSGTGQVMTFAIVLGRIARASSSGEWRMRVRVNTFSDPLPTDRIISNLSMAPNFEFAQLDSAAHFGPGEVGQAGIPLIEPASGFVAVEVLTNAPSELRLRGTDLIGTQMPTVFPVGFPNQNLKWASSTGDSAKLDTAFVSMAPALSPNVDEQSQPFELTLHAAIPNGLTTQTYRGRLDLRIQETSGSAKADAPLPVSARVVSTLAAQSAVAEVLPHVVTVGTSGQPFVAYLEPAFTGSSTGIDQIRIPLPIGYGPPAITQFRVGSAQPPFVDNSGPNSVMLTFATVTSPERLMVVFNASVPTAANPAGSPFPVFFDDTSTPTVPEQIAVEGDANGVSDGDSWLVHVYPGPLAGLSVVPETGTVALGDTLRLHATGRDDFGNPIAIAAGWRVEGGIGTVDGGGLFTATGIGSGYVIAQVGSYSDTARLTTMLRPNEFEVTAVQQYPRVLIPGADRSEILSFEIANRSVSRETLQVIRVENRTTGLGNQAELDGDWSPIHLVLERGAGATPETLGVGNFIAGSVVFSGLTAAFDSDESAILRLVGNATLAARDGDSLDLRIADPSSVVASVPVEASWPIDPPGAFRVDGMSAAQITLTTVPVGNLPIGARRRPVLHARLPQNGYAADVLVRMNVVNLGTAQPMTDIETVELWSDNGDGRFEAATDVLLGPMLFTGDRWEITGLAQPVGAVGMPIFVTVDITATAAEGRTVRFALPAPADVGVGMMSGNSGPVDVAVENPFEQLTSAQDRVTLAARAIAPDVVRPDAEDVRLLELVVGNTYGTTRALTGLTVTNRTLGSGTMAERDGAFHRVELRWDGDGDGLLGDLTADPLLATSTFTSGRAVFSGFSWNLPAGESRLLFVTGDVSVTGASDGDSLSAHLASGADVAIDSLSSIAASFPVTSRSRWVVDGMIAEQIRVIPVPGVTLGPNDGPTRVFDAIVPRNGYADDILRGVRFENRGTAGPAAVSELRLWRDDGDGVFQPTADQDLGPLTLLGGAWQSSFLAEPLSATGARLFVSLVVSSAPTDSSTLRLEIPVDGILTESGNRGPLDHGVGNPEPLLLSSAPLLATLSVDRNATTVGGLVAVQMVVRNVGLERVQNVVPSALALSGLGISTYLTGPQPASADLDPGQSATFSWSYQSTSPGTVRWSGNAAGTGSPSGLQRRALNVQSGLHQVFVQAESLACFAIQSMPFTVNQGQTDVVPLTLTFSNESNQSSSAVRLDGLRIRLESGSGGAVVPAQIISRVVVQEGSDVYVSRTNLETSGSVMDLTFATPVTILQSQPVTLAVRFDVAPLANAASFRMIVDDSTMIVAEDANSGAPVEVQLKNQSYPIRTGLARIVQSASELELSAADTTAVPTSPGITGTGLMRLRLEHNGVPGLTSEIRLGGLAVVLVDSTGRTVPEPDRWISRLRVFGPYTTVCDRPVSAADDSVLTLGFSPLVTVPLNALLELELLADIASDAPIGSFRLEVRDTAQVDARDANTGERVAIRFGSEPLLGPRIVIQQPADRLRASGTPEFPPVVSVGRSSLRALSARFRHPGAPGTAAIRIDRLVFQVQDAARQPLPPATFVDVLRVLWNGAVVATVTDPPTSGGIVVPLPGVAVAAGTADSMWVELDFQATAPTGFVELLLTGAGIVALDAITSLPVEVLAEAGESLPLTSGLTRLEPPARTLVADLESTVSAALPGDGSTVPLATVTLTNAAAPGSGTIAVQSLRFGGGDRDLAAVPVGRFAAALAAYRDGVLWATSETLTPDSTSATLTSLAPLELAPGPPVVLEIRLVTRTGGGPGSFRASLDAAGVGVVQPASAVLAVAIQPSAGRAFPMWTDGTGYTGTSVAESYSNYPNPFPAGRGSTQFVFYLPSPGHVDLVIWTARGERVVGLLDNVPLGSGLHQSLNWDGRNGRGTVVTNGVYVAELVARLDDGTRERVLRKVMVVR